MNPAGPTGPPRWNGFGYFLIEAGLEIPLALPDELAARSRSNAYSVLPSLAAAIALR
jgi:hypothetical protein